MGVGGKKVCRATDLCLYRTAFQVFLGADFDHHSAAALVPTKFAVSPNFVPELDALDPGI